MKTIDISGKRSDTMDFVYVGIVIAFSILSWLFVRLIGKV
jgi:hypothetical protein